jgi:branched-chain amino acid aminotransferase
MNSGSHNYLTDPRNEDISININGEMFHRNDAKISVFDSAFILGDGIWEGLRLHRGKLPFIKEHMQRLYEGAKALDMDIGLSKEDLIRRIYATCPAKPIKCMTMCIFG